MSKANQVWGVGRCRALIYHLTCPNTFSSPCSVSLDTKGTPIQSIDTCFARCLQSQHYQINGHHVTHVWVCARNSSCSCMAEVYKERTYNVPQYLPPFWSRTWISCPETLSIPRNAPTLGLCRNIDMAIRERLTTVTVMQEFSAK